VGQVSNPWGRFLTCHATVAALIRAYEYEVVASSMTRRHSTVKFQATIVTRYRFACPHPYYDAKRELAERFK
jgi:hypothetical protein